jgi:hypothetical protein
MTAEEREKFTGLSQAPPRLQPQPKKFAIHQMPTYFHVNAHTAFPGSSRPERPGPARTAAPEMGNAVAGGPAAPGRPVVSAPSPAFCTQCGARHVAGDNFCAQCGVPMHGVGGYQGQSVTSY